jgi:hypothetical protein
MNQRHSEASKILDIERDKLIKPRAQEHRNEPGVVRSFSVNNEFVD